MSIILIIFSILVVIRSDAFGTVVRWDKNNWVEKNVESELAPTFSLCST